MSKQRDGREVFLRQPKKTSGLCYDNTALRRSSYTSEPVSSSQELEAFTVRMFPINYKYRVILYLGTLHIFETSLFHNNSGLFSEASLKYLRLIRHFFFLFLSLMHSRCDLPRRSTALKFYDKPLTPILFCACKHSDVNVNSTETIEMLFPYFVFVFMLTFPKKEMFPCLLLLVKSKLSRMLRMEDRLAPWIIKTLLSG